VDVGSVTDASEVYVVSIFRVEMRTVNECSCTSRGPEGHAVA
jgi:hypothetical protein